MRSSTQRAVGEDAGERHDRVLNHPALGAERLRPRQLVGIRRRHRMIGALDVPSGRLGEDRVAQWLAVALEPDQRPTLGLHVATVLGNREASLDRVPNGDVDERGAAASWIVRERPRIEHREHGVLVAGRERRERASLGHGRDRIDLGEALPVEIAQALLRTAELRIDARELGESGRAEELLEARRRDELLEAVRRTLAGRKAGLRIRKWGASAEWPASQEARALSV